MKILHTSDWHIGQSLYGRNRYLEFEKFLDWLSELLENERIDALLVAGDVFDSSTPSHRAQELYYRFLHRTAASRCRHVVVTAGNHDSPSFLNAPKEILKFLNVHVVGAGTDPPADEALLLSGENGEPELIVCAVPYLRDRDIRTAEPGESIADKGRKLVEGIRGHYHQVCAAAEAIRQSLKNPVPIVAMGHLFAAGGQSEGSEGIRELYVGTLAQVGGDVFPKNIDYLALGHLHASQCVGGSETMRYSGSPLCMGFVEAGQEKQVLRVVFSNSRPIVTAINVPRFQTLERVRGSGTAISQRIHELKSTGSRAWLEVVHEGGENAGHLSEQLYAAIAGTRMEILCVKNHLNTYSDGSAGQIGETLDDLGIEAVFHRCLDAHGVSETRRSELLQTYREAVTGVHEADPLAG